MELPPEMFELDLLEARKQGCEYMAVDLPTPFAAVPFLYLLVPFSSFFALALAVLVLPVSLDGPFRALFVAFLCRHTLGAPLLGVLHT